MANTKDRLARVVTGAHKAIYRRTDGRVGGRVAGMPVLILTTRGAKTGKARTTVLGYLADGDRLVLVASNGGDSRHPGWYRNLSADPEVLVTLGASTRPMKAHTAAAEEKEVLWPRVVAAYRGYGRYQERTTRDIPVVVLERR